MQWKIFIQTIIYTKKKKKSSIISKKSTEAYKNEMWMQKCFIKLVKQYWKNKILDVFLKSCIYET